MALQLFHNPRCSKSRATLALLESKGLEPHIVEYLKEPPSLQTLKDLHRALGCKAIEMIRAQESIFGELGLADADDETLLRAVTEHPILLERPIVLNKGRAAIGRPPENVLGIL